ncbi:hypothetical protein OG930_38580 [Streptomyces sp. NBC_01799]|uniref:hypothetical protein n=1 Tax=Streptomyces sp. NBC_01800 TaxID=2975945 RepID=UPI002DD9F5AB|nr:hypothetical protein [Streptomyces sp. NBC_01800]WSA72469.1 hypothetical protein OIE65_39205 [Streptomyces sp. NBC_01800]WSA80993.1 hypothetical protein OG930_38580 [Streptomyces sp. NBC_01799]
MTRDDVLTQLDALQGSQRGHTLIVLRSLFGRAKKSGTIFKNPTSRIRVGQHEYGILQPLEPEHVNNSVATVAKPADRLVLALAAVHAARSGAIRRLQRDDLDIGNRKFVIDDHVRPLDELRGHADRHGRSPLADGASTGSVIMELRRSVTTGDPVPAMPSCWRARPRSRGR